MHLSLGMLAGTVVADITVQDPSSLSPALIRATKAPGVPDPTVHADMLQSPHTSGLQARH